MIAAGAGVTVFQSTLPRGERLRLTCRAGRGEVFQSTLPRGERPPSTTGRRRTVFQSTLPRGERPRATSDRRRPGWFQSTLPRGERRSMSPAGVKDHRVSIHAPAWGATIDPADVRPGRSRFNPRSRVGSDPRPT